MIQLLHTLVLLGTVLAVHPCSEPGRDQDEKMALDRLRAAGASVVEVDDSETGPGIAVDFQNKVSEKMLALLRDVKRLVALRILGGCEKDTGVRSLESLTNLRLLVINTDSLTDAGMESVGKLRSLVKLDVMKGTVTTKGMTHLKSLNKLRRLYLFGARVQDEALVPLEEMNWLSVIDLPPTVSEKAVNRLRHKLPNTQIKRWTQ